MDSINQVKEKVQSRLCHFIICYLGICSLLAYNCLISAIDIFNEYKQFRIEFFFPFSFNMISIITQVVLFVVKQNTISRFKLMLFSIICILVLFCSLPLVVAYINNFNGFVVCLVIIGLLGLFTNIFLFCTYGLTGLLEFSMLISLNLGNALSGILCNAIRYLLVVFNVANGEIIYFFVGGTILIIGAVLLIIFFNSEYIEYNYFKSGEISQAKYLLVKEKYKLDDIEILNQKECNLKNIVIKLFKLSFTVFLSFFTTYFIYPSLAYQFSMYDLNKEYLYNTISFIYNAFYSIGMFTPMVIKISENNSFKIAVFRLFFNYLFISLIFCLEKYEYITVFYSSTLMVLSLIILGFYNGFLCSTSFYYIQFAINENHDVATSYLNIMIPLGIFSGSLHSVLITQWLI